MLQEGICQKLLPPSEGSAMYTPARYSQVGWLDSPVKLDPVCSFNIRYFNFLAIYIGVHLSKDIAEEPCLLGVQFWSFACSSWPRPLICKLLGWLRRRPAAMSLVFMARRAPFLFLLAVALLEVLARACTKHVYRRHCRRHQLTSSPAAVDAVEPYGRPQATALAIRRPCVYSKLEIDLSS